MKQLIFILINLITLQSFSQTDNCDVEFSFKPAGLYFDRDTKEYISGLELGSQNMSFDIELCKFDSRSGKLHLTARVFNKEAYTIYPATKDTIQGSLPFIRVFKATREEDNLNEIQTLCQSDSNGQIEIKTKLNHQEKIYFEADGYNLYQLNIEE